MNATLAGLILALLANDASTRPDVDGLCLTPPRLDAYGLDPLYAEPAAGLFQADPVPPSRRNPWYFQAGFGLVTTDDSGGPGEEIDFDEGYGVPVAIGRRYYGSDGNPFSLDVELEGLWTDQDAEDQGPIQAVTDVSQLGLFLNGVADVRLGDPLSLYGGAGIGASFLDVGTESDALNDFDEEDGPFLAWQLKAGVRLWATRSISWNFGYRFVNIDDVQLDDDIGGASFDLETSQHMLELGLRFQL